MPRNKPLPTIEELQDHDPQTVANQCSTPIIWADHQVTRRQRLHGCNIPGGTESFASTHFNEVLEHLTKIGWKEAILVCETPRRTHLACYIQFEPLAQ